MAGVISAVQEIQEETTVIPAQQIACQRLLQTMFTICFVSSQFKQYKICWARARLADAH